MKVPCSCLSEKTSCTAAPVYTNPRQHVAAHMSFLLNDTPRIRKDRLGEEQKLTSKSTEQRAHPVIHLPSTPATRAEHSRPALQQTMDYLSNPPLSMSAPRTHVGMFIHPPTQTHTHTCTLAALDSIYGGTM